MRLQFVIFMVCICLGGALGYRPTTQITSGSGAKISGDRQSPSARTSIISEPRDETANGGVLVSTSFSAKLGEIKADDWKSLIASKPSRPSEEWLRQRDLLMIRIRPYADKNYRGQLSRWEDPGGALSLGFLDAWGRDRSGKLATEWIDKISNKDAILELCASGNISGDWVVSADYYSKVQDVPSDKHAQMLDILVEAWIAKEGHGVVSVWLASHSADPLFDLARRTAFLESKGTASVLLTQMSSAEKAEEARIMAEAFVF